MSTLHVVVDEELFPAKQCFTQAIAGDYEEMYQQAVAQTREVLQKALKEACESNHLSPTVHAEILHKDVPYTIALVIAGRVRDALKEYGYDSMIEKTDDYVCGRRMWLKIGLV
jgi:lactam utilization protein B